MEGKAVILADDEDFALNTISKMFGALKVNVTTAKDGKQALDAYKAINGVGISYILMDIHMPVMDGYESTKQIRAYEKSKGLKACKILGLSGDGDEKTKQNCLASGMNDLLSKPVKKDQLSAQL